MEYFHGELSEEPRPEPPTLALAWLGLAWLALGATRGTPLTRPVCDGVAGDTALVPCRWVNLVVGIHALLDELTIISQGIYK
jgi:hypothetical protein